jgi:hypothetical protein
VEKDRLKKVNKLNTVLGALTLIFLCVIGFNLSTRWSGTRVKYHRITAGMTFEQIRGLGLATYSAIDPATGRPLPLRTSFEKEHFGSRDGSGQITLFYVEGRVISKRFEMAGVTLADNFGVQEVECERLAEVEPGMTRQQVRQTLGEPLWTTTETAPTTRPSDRCTWMGWGCDGEVKVVRFRGDVVENFE